MDESVEKLGSLAEKYVAWIESYFRCQKNESLDRIGIGRDLGTGRLRIVHGANLVMRHERPGQRRLICGDMSQIGELGKSHEEREERVPYSAELAA
jgi:hypothetical protein